jgi:hypothetical protein
MAGSQQVITTKIRGINTHPSQYGDNLPEGASSVCDNITLDAESIAQTRRGLFRYGQSLGVGNAVKEVLQYGEDLIIHTDNGNLYYDSDRKGTWTRYPGLYSSPSQTLRSRIRSAESNKNFYFLSSNGAMKLDALDSVPVPAGAPKGLGGVATLTTGSFLANNSIVAYRVVWGYVDNNNNLILGAPSERILCANKSGSAANVNLTFTVPRNVDTTWFYQVYRSFQQDTTTVTGAEPNDELQQCFEGNLTAAQLSTRTVTVTDTTPDELLQGSLYTDPSQQDINQANWQPPFAQDLTVFKGYTFYGNTRTVHRLNLTEIAGGTVSGSGFKVGDTISFINTTDNSAFILIAGTLENQTNGTFAISITGDPAVDIQATAQSLVKICNLYSGNHFLDAYYMSDFDQLPGQMLFQKANLSPEPFYVQTSANNAFSFAIPASGMTSKNTSQNDNLPNRLFYSKFLQPEAVPLLNYFDVGSANQPIRRIIALRDSLIILKKDGVFRLYGANAPFTLTPLDNTVEILSDNSAVLLNNNVYFLSDQGVVRATDDSVSIVSRPIETDILKLTTTDSFPNFPDVSFAISYESDRKYILGLQTSADDETCPQQYTYNYITQDWTRWTRSMNCGLVNIRDNKLYYGGPSDPAFGAYVFVERKNYVSTDFADEEYTVNIVSSFGKSITVDSTANMAVGNTLYQSQDVQAEIVAIVNPTTIQVNNIVGWSVGPATIYVQIEDVLETIQIDCKNPGIMKHFRSISYIFSDSNFDELDVTYSCDTSQSTFTQMLKNNSGASFGLFNWGKKKWGGEMGGKTRIETKFPRNVQRADWITIRVECKKAFSSFGLSGFSTVYTTGTERKGGNQVNK